MSLPNTHLPWFHLNHSHFWYNGNVSKSILFSKFEIFHIISFRWKKKRFFIFHMILHKQKMFLTLLQCSCLIETIRLVKFINNKLVCFCLFVLNTFVYDWKSDFLFSLISKQPSCQRVLTITIQYVYNTKKNEIYSTGRKFLTQYTEW